MPPEAPQPVLAHASSPADATEAKMREPGTHTTLEMGSGEENGIPQKREGTDQTPGNHTADTATPEGVSLVENIPSAEDFYEAEDDAEMWARRSTVTPAARELLDKEIRNDRLQIRSNQAIIHHNLTAARIDKLEEDFRELKTAVFNLGDELDVSKHGKERLPVNLHELKVSSRNEFRITRERITLPTTKQHALEILLSELMVSQPLPGTSEGNVQPQPEPQSPRNDDGDGRKTGVVQITPDRLRIRSRPLLLHLQKVTNNPLLSLTNIDRVGDEKVYNAVVFLRPFKYFVKNHSAIRQSLELLENAMKNETSENRKQEAAPRKTRGKLSKADDEGFDNKDLLQDLRLLVKFIDKHLQPTFDIRQQIKDGTATEIEYADLWHLFERGEYVVTRSKRDHAYMVINITGGRDPLTNKLRVEDAEKSAPVNGFVVDCFSLGNNGSSYVPKLHKISIRKFHGRQPIASLPVYPLRFDPNANELRSRFSKTGREFVDVTRHSFIHRIVRGKTLDEPSHDIDGQAIVDMTLAINGNPQWRLKKHILADDLTLRDKRETHSATWCTHDSRSEGCCGSDIIFKDLEYDDLETENFLRTTGRLLSPVSREEINEEELMLMRPYVHAFVLRSRQWVTVRTEHLYDVVFENNFTDLVLPESHKTTVQALVRTHENSRTPDPSAVDNPSIGAALDLVKGKGSGLVILLHGPPGVGKTSTAECVADDTRRPLYPITCGDIGETAAEVEANLQHNFRLAHKWGCVLLLDEADIFLAKRTKSDLRHNAVTSVFLRSLEYYAGILFLTTNRVGAIDPAFKSRIQMSLFYQKLDLEVTLKLYEKFIKRARAEQDRTKSYIFRIKEKEIMKFAKRHFRSLEKQHFDTWNGRQIRNAFQTAIALVEHQSMTQVEEDPKPVLGKAQFETVANGFQQFDEYLVMTLGATEADNAKREGMRDDGFMTGAASNAGALLTPPAATPRANHWRGGGQPGRLAPQESDSDDDSGSDSESESDGADSAKRSKKRKDKHASSGEEPTGAPSGQSNEMEEFRQFMAWKKMQS